MQQLLLCFFVSRKNASLHVRFDFNPMNTKFPDCGMLTLCRSFFSPRCIFVQSLANIFFSHLVQEFHLFRTHRHNAPGRNWLKSVLHLQWGEFLNDDCCALKFGFSGGDRLAGWKIAISIIATCQSRVRYLKCRSNAALPELLSITTEKQIPTAITSESYPF